MDDKEALRFEVERQVTTKRFRCDQCEAAMINGVFCHETGCPNSRKTWVPEREEWVRYVECRECGDQVEEGEDCSCRDLEFDYIEQEDEDMEDDGE